MQARQVTAYREAAVVRAGTELALGQDPQLERHFHLGETREMISTCSSSSWRLASRFSSGAPKVSTSRGMAAAADTKDHPAAGQDVGGHKVLAETQPVTPRRDGEGAADLQVFVTWAKCTAGIRSSGMCS